MREDEFENLHAFADGKAVISCEFEYPQDAVDNTTADRDAFAVQAISRLLAELRQTSNPTLAIDCLLYACGGFISKSITINDICSWHHVSAKSVHGRVSDTWQRLGLPASTKSALNPNWKCADGKPTGAPVRFTSYLCHVRALVAALREFEGHRDGYTPEFAR